MSIKEDPDTRKIKFTDIFKSIGSIKIKFLKTIDYLLGNILVLFIKDQRFSRHTEISTKNIKSILVIRPGGIGDAIFLLPFINSIKRHAPAIRIDILCEKRNSSVFKDQSSAGDIHLLDSPAFLKVFQRTYDIVFDTEQWHYLSALACYFTRHKHSFGFATRLLRAKLFNRAMIYKTNTYEIENFKTLFKEAFPCVAEVTGIDHSFSVTEAASQWAQETIPPGSVTIFIGASIALRRLTESQCLKLINFIISKNLTAVIVGGKDVERISESLKKATNNQSVLYFTGKTSLEQSAALIKKSRLFIGPDSGVMHLACAVGTPVVAIFGPGNLEKWGPKGPPHAVITENVKCAPCTAFGYTVPTCRGSYICVKEINWSRVLETLSSYL